LLNELLRHLY